MTNITSPETARKIFEKQKANRWRVAQTTANERIEKLLKLKKAILAQQIDLGQAICDDFRKNPAETDLTEVFPVIAEINHTIKHLKNWMKPVRTKTPLALFGTRSEVRYEAKGLVLVLAPWNYPFQLAVTPVVTAIAAGNCVILKPSTKVPHTAQFLNNLLSNIFDESEVAVVEGGHSLSDSLLELPFDHIFFTGSPRIGKHVMQAAAKHLTTVTLELGGKSPAIVDESANLQKTAERILWGKFVNSGQTCVAPDYLLIHEGRLETFIKEAKSILSKRYGATSAARASCDSFCRLVSQEHAEHLKQLLDDSVRAGAKIETGSEFSKEERYLSPTLLTHVTTESPIMREEIFGPILPILTYRSLDEAIAIIQNHEKPLALYLFSENQASIDRVLRRTTAGGTCINSTLIHLANTNLPFGGVGNSGMGNYHGFFGFRTLSHERAVLRQKTPDLMRLFYPPYTPWVKGLIQAAVKFLS